MTRLPLAVALLAVMLPAITGLDAQAPRRDIARTSTHTAAIRGRVLAADGALLRKALVTLSGDDRAPVLTDDVGRFAFPGLAAGRYTVWAEKTGYATSRFGERGVFDRPIPIVLAEGSSADSIDIHLPRGAAITGRVLDELGDPVVGARVTAGQLVHERGTATLRGARSTQTDDLGEYRIGALRAGQYIVRVGPTLDGGAFFPGGTVFAETYFPHTPSLAQAQPVAATEGDDASGIDFVLMPVRRPTVTIGATDRFGQPAQGEFVISSASRVGVLNESGRLRDGYAWSTVDPGDWTLFVSGPQGAGLLSLTLTDDTSVSLVLQPPATMTGRIVFEGTTRAEAPALTIDAVPDTPELQPVGRARAVSRINRDGTFTISNLIGRRFFTLSNAPAGTFLKLLTRGEQNLLDGTVTFNGETLAGVVAVIGRERATLRATARGADDAPALDYSVVVFPEQRARWTDPLRWVRWARADHLGRVAIDDLPAGRYRAIALTAVDGARWGDPRYLEALSPGTTPLVLGDGGATDIVLPLMRTP